MCRLCLTMKRKAKKPRKQSEAEEPDAVYPRTAGSLSEMAVTTSATVPTNWSAFLAPQAVSVGGGLESRRAGPQPWDYANALARPLDAEQIEGRYSSLYPRAFSASNVQSSQQTFVTARRASQSLVGLEELSRMYARSNAQFSMNSFLQREAQQQAPERNQTFSTRNDRSHESFHADERIRCDQVGILPTLDFRQEGTAGEGADSQVWLPYQQQAANRLHDDDMGKSSMPSSSSLHVDQHAVALSSMARQPPSSPSAGTSDTLLPCSSGDDWCPGDPAEEASGETAQLPLGAMSPLHFGENETISSSD